MCSLSFGNLNASEECCPLCHGLQLAPLQLAGPRSMGEHIGVHEAASFEPLLYASVPSFSCELRASPPTAR